MQTNIREFLTFKLGNEEYGIDIQCVQEIRSYEQPTRIANAPPAVRGVINLRGVIVPIVDLRLRLNMAEAAYDAFTGLIVVTAGGKVTGLVVDRVNDVTNLAPEQLRPVPEFGAAVDADYLMAIGSLDDRMLMLMDVERLLTGHTVVLPEPVAA